MNQDHDKVEDLEADIANIRAALDGTLDRLASKMSPGSLAGAALDAAQDKGAVLADRAADLLARKSVQAAVSLGVGLSLFKAGKALRSKLSAMRKKRAVRAYADQAKEKLLDVIDSARARTKALRAQTRTEDGRSGKRLFAGALMFAAGAAIATLVSRNKEAGKHEPKTVAASARRLRKKAVTALAAKAERGANAASAALRSRREATEARNAGAPKDQPPIH